MNEQLHQTLDALEGQKKLTRTIKRQLDRALENNVNLYAENRRLAQENKQLKNQLRQRVA